MGGQAELSSLPISSILRTSKLIKMAYTKVPVALRLFQSTPARLLSLPGTRGFIASRPLNSADVPSEDRASIVAVMKEAILKGPEKGLELLRARLELQGPQDPAKGDPAKAQKIIEEVMAREPEEERDIIHEMLTTGELSGADFKAYILRAKGLH